MTFPTVNPQPDGRLLAQTYCGHGDDRKFARADLPMCSACKKALKGACFRILAATSLATNVRLQKEQTLAQRITSSLYAMKTRVPDVFTFIVMTVAFLKIADDKKLRCTPPALAGFYYREYLDETKLATHPANEFVPIGLFNGRPYILTSRFALHEDVHPEVVASLLGHAGFPSMDPYFESAAKIRSYRISDPAFAAIYVDDDLARSAYRAYLNVLGSEVYPGVPHHGRHHASIALSDSGVAVEAVQAYYTLMSMTAHRPAVLPPHSRERDPVPVDAYLEGARSIVLEEASDSSDSSLEEAVRTADLSEEEEDDDLPPTVDDTIEGDD